MIDWAAPAKLFERDDSGSERDYDFHERGTGTVGALIASVAAMTVDARGRLLIDAGPIGTFNIGQIIEMSMRPDFPG
jgi:hypothetical protein